MLTIHHLGYSQSERIVWLCEELEIPYNLIKYERDAATHLAPADYKALHPFGTAPVITDGDLVLGESGAIIEYIIAKHGGGRLSVRTDAANYADYLYWYHFANASFMPALMVDTIVTLLDMPGLVAPKQLSVRKESAYAMCDARLGECDYFAGSDFTAADIIMLFPLTTMRIFMPQDISEFPNLRSYLQRIGERPAYRRAMAKGDPDMPLKLT